ncbi:redoxin domain-containing protein [Burkholderia plantarii]|uniref:redoxin domain-containing protein n=1 Tax=Burkholderia plantarii TaxID=41899 RepID=UPI0006D8A269|nr:redoxin domain-containing protein [Burkholderia plantarii]ALK31064.1 Alkyl hydroperoxide reductase/ Thiol specific antioxidant/ Mal allergen [Burkholderia plantarii]WLE59709.1 redoxin domain-containing protein [Burkholderia plantarii]GLZ17311.1 alkyl hydroperoxide reductase [Burkholderia plantarii]
MKTVGDLLDTFTVTAAKPGFNHPEENGQSAFETITEASFPGKWKVFYFYPKDFSPVCAAEIVEFGRLRAAFEQRDAVLLGGSADNELVKLAWRRAHPGLDRLNHHAFGDVKGELIDQLGIRDHDAGVALRATFIVDADNTIRHVSVNSLDVGRNPAEILRTLEALQTGEPCPPVSAAGDPAP